MTEQQLLAEQIQKECESFVYQKVSEGAPYIQDEVNNFLFSKLAEMELRLRALENNVSRLDSENSLNRPLM